MKISNFFVFQSICLGAYPGVQITHGQYFIIIHSPVELRLENNSNSSIKCGVSIKTKLIPIFSGMKDGCDVFGSVGSDDIVKLVVDNSSGEAIQIKLHEPLCRINFVKQAPFTFFNSPV